jgi:hypothetical protein
VSPAGDEVTSLTEIGSAGHKGAVAFTTTHWSVVLEAQRESPAAQEALEKLCRTYWRPIYGFVRRQGIGPEEAEDLTQGFFALLLERRDLDAVRKEKGRLRSYLLTSLKHFLTNERNRALAIKRGEGQRLIPLDQLHAGEHIGFEPADTDCRANLRTPLGAGVARSSNGATARRLSGRWSRVRGIVWLATEIADGGNGPSIVRRDRARIRHDRGRRKASTPAIAPQNKPRYRAEKLL